ncbi:MAG: ketopantoate reductase family protein [Deltaproteobacteria bacterium]|nr:ketopantoate reductase family protein [Deltaproteobacteria bacterium]
MKILVLGAGAIGSVFGGFLAKNGHEVILFGREHCIGPINNHGLHIEGIWGKHHITNIKGYSSLNKIARSEGRTFDLTLLTVKSYDTIDIIRNYVHTIGKSILTVSLQNGLGNLEAIADILGKDKAIGGRVIFGAELVEQARVKVTVYADKVVLGSLKYGVPLEKVEEIAELFDNSGIPTSSTEEIEKFIWGKVLYNCALNALSCLLEVNYGKLLENPQTKTIMENIVRELFKVLHGEKVVVDWNEADEYIKELFDHLIPATYDHYSSMLQDIRTGKKTEIDALNGKVVAMAEEMGLDLPVNRVITSLVKAKKVTITLDN